MKSKLLRWVHGRLERFLCRQMMLLHREQRRTGVWGKTSLLFKLVSKLEMYLRYRVYPKHG